ncbi:MAG: hypothetical protein RR733_04150, partial [Victivallaceae bacterium]
MTDGSNIVSGKYFPKKLLLILKSLKMKLLFGFLIFLTFFSVSDAAIRSDQAIKEVYRHSYGIIISRDEWIRRGKDGSITKLLKDGTTVSESYFQGLLNGEVIVSYPHSATIALREQYEHGVLLSRRHFFINGLPKQEEIFNSDGSIIISSWKDDDIAHTPPFITETFSDRKLISGTYITPVGEKVHIVDGEGIRPCYSAQGELLSEE